MPGSTHVRTCWREVLSVLTIAVWAYSTIRQQVLAPVCESLAASAAEPRGVHQGPRQFTVCSDALSGCLEVAPWAQQVLCDPVWYSTWWQMAPGQDVLRYAADIVLGVLVRPLVLAWVTHDPHYLYHLAATALLGALIIWPTLHQVPVAQRTRGAAHALLRLLFDATTTASTHTPAGLVLVHLSDVLSSQGRWVVFATSAWMQGLLLQVPLPLQLLLSLLDWWSASHVCSSIQARLGLGQPSRLQLLLEAACTLVLPLAPLLLSYLRRWRMPGVGATHQQQQAAAEWPPASASAESAQAGSSGRSVVKQRAPVQPAAGPHEHVHTGAKQAAAQPQGSTDTLTPAGSPRSTSGSNDSAQGTRGSPGGVARPRHIRQPSDGQPLPLPGGCPAAVHSGDTTEPGAVQQLLAGWGQPGAAVQSWVAGEEAAFLMPGRLRYIPCCEMVPISFKVQEPPGMSYTDAAAAVTATITRELQRPDSGGLLAHTLATVPGCVLLLGEAVRPARRPPGPAPGDMQWQQVSGDEEVLGEGDLVMSLLAWLQQGWLVPIRLPCGPCPPAAVAAPRPAGSPAPRQPASSTIRVRGLPAEVQARLQQSLVEVLEQQEAQEHSGGSSSSRSHEEGAASEQERGSNPAPAHNQEPPATAAQPTGMGSLASCVVGTWGQPLVLQLVPVGASSVSDHPPEPPVAGPGSGLERPGAVRLVVVHSKQVLLDEVVQLGAPGASGGTLPSLTMTCSHDLLEEASAGPTPTAATATTAVSQPPAVLSVYIIHASATATTPGGVLNSGLGAPSDVSAAIVERPQHGLPAAHITLLLLPPEPAAELVGWVAAAQLALAQVATWGGDLAVLVGCAEQLTAAQAASGGRQGPDGGACTAALVSLARLATAAAGNLSCFFSAVGLGCTADLVAVLRQRVLVGATSLAPMAAGRVVPAVGGGGAAARAGDGGLAAEGWAAGPVSISSSEAQLPAIRVCVSGGRQPARITAAASAATTILATPSFANVAAPTLQSAAAATPLSETECATPGADCVRGDPYHDRSWDWAVRGPAPAPQPPSSAASRRFSQVHLPPADTCPAAARQPGLKPAPQHAAAPYQVAPWEAASLSCSWQQAMPLCWHGFKDAGAEASYRSFYGLFVRRWEVVARAYHLAVGLALLVKMADQPHNRAVLWGWGGLPVAFSIGELAVHLVLVAAAPAWWALWRDTLLGSFYLRAGCALVWQVLAWPPAMFRDMYGYGVSTLLLPVVFLLTPIRPKAALAGGACMSALGYTALLLCSVQDPLGRLSAPLGAGVRSASGWVVAGAMGYSLVTVAGMLLVSFAAEVMVRRAWVRREQQRQQQQQQLAACDSPSSSSTTGAGAGAGGRTRRPPWC